MSAENRRVWAIVGVLLLAVALLLLFGRARQELAPEPRAAWVAIEPKGSDRAVVGRIELASGEPFLLRAVLAAEDWRGETIYYSEAERLEIDGREVPPERLRRWTGAEVRPLWFTVEGNRRYLEIGEGEAEELFGFREVFQPDWPRAWTVPGTVRSSGPPPGLFAPPFGTQRYHVRLELFGPESAIRPRLRIRSAGAEALPERAAGFPTVTASLPGRLAVPSRVFGLTQIERRPGIQREAGLRLAAWTAADLAFTRLSLIRRVLDADGVSWDELGWRSVDLEAGAAWGAPGEMVRAGPRVVFLFEDRGRPGILDPADLCFDYDLGAQIRTLGEIFTGEGLVEVARRGPA